MTYYGMHDAPGTKQNTNAFTKKDGRKIDTGDIHSIMMPWGFMNPFLEKDLFENNFYDIENKCYKKDIDIDKLQELVGKNKEELENIPLLKKWVRNGVTEFVIDSKNKIRQSYMFLSLNRNDYLIIRGKKNDLPEAYVFKVIQPGVIKYNSRCIPYMTFKVICKVPNEVYKKLEARRASMWKLLERDFKEIEKLV
jgi:hypothetical protein